MTRKKIIMAILVAAFLILMLIGLQYRSGGDASQSPLADKPLKPTALPTASTEPTDMALPAATRTPTRAVLSPTTANEANIKVFSPRNNDKVSKSFVVTGEARVFENVFQVRVTNAATKEVLFNQNAMSEAQDTGQFGRYSVTVDLPTANLRTGDSLLLEVFQYSAKDGSEIDKVSVPLTFSSS